MLLTKNQSKNNELVNWTKNYIPSEIITEGLKTLWHQDLFSDIQISKREKNEKEIVLEIYLEAAKSLAKFKFNGIRRKGEIREQLDFILEWL